MTIDAERHEQILRQHRVVAHLANTLSVLHFELADLHRHTTSDGVLEMVGERTARLMEMLGDVINGMDAASAEDQWMDAIFEKAHELWPSRACPHCGRAQGMEAQRGETALAGSPGEAGDSPTPQRGDAP